MDALASDLSRVDVDQSYGIELGEFPARIAETALWMMDHIMNNRLSLSITEDIVKPSHKLTQLYDALPKNEKRKPDYHSS